jgi:hypothetical protein
LLTQNKGCELLLSAAEYGWVMPAWALAVVVPLRAGATIPKIASSLFGPWARMNAMPVCTTRQFAGNAIEAVRFGKTYELSGGSAALLDCAWPCAAALAAARSAIEVMKLPQTPVRIAVARMIFPFSLSCRNASVVRQYGGSKCLCRSAKHPRVGRA